LPENIRRDSIESPTKPKPEIQTIANAQDKEIWKRDPIALAKRRSGVESEGGIRRWNRENGCAAVGGEEGNVAEGEQAAESDQHREGIHSPPIEDYMVYIHTFSGAPEPELFSRSNVGKIPREKSI
jgi:hypothetical protein